MYSNNCLWILYALSIHTDDGIIRDHQYERVVLAFLLNMIRSRNVIINFWFFFSVVILIESNAMNVEQSNVVEKIISK